MFRYLGMTWWGYGCSGPRTLRDAFKCHETLPMRQERTQTAPKVYYARTCKREPPVIMPTYTSVPFSAAYYKFPVFLHFQCCTEQTRYGNAHTAHTSEVYQNRNLSENCAKKRSDTQMTVYEFPYHKDTIRFRKADRTDHRRHHSTHLFLILRSPLLISFHPSTYLSVSFLARSKNSQKLHVRPTAHME